MRKFSWKQAQGLAWFFLVYALSRFLISLPVMAHQSPELFGLFFGAMIVSWLGYISQKDEEGFNLLITSISLVSLFIFFYFGYFAKLEILIALILVGGLSLLYLLVFLAQSVKKFLKKQENILWPIIIQGLATVIFIVAFEYILPMLKNLFS